jgi:hypothetical protein
MTTSIQGGPLGLEAVHNWDGVFDTNDLEAGFPRVRWRRIRGLLSLAEGDDDSISGGARIGIRPTPGLLRDKTNVYEGFLEADTLHEIRELRTEMVGAFADRYSEKVMTITPHPDYGDTVFFYYGKCIALDIDDLPPSSLNRLPSKEAREVTLSIRQYDPRFYHSVLQDSGEQAAGFAVTNLGLAPAEPDITLTIGDTAGGTTLSVTNTSIGKKLQLQTLFLVAAGKITFNFRRRRILYYIDGGDPNDPLDITRMIDQEESTWWDHGVHGLTPGVNNLTWVGADIDTVRVTHHHATF